MANKKEGQRSCEIWSREIRSTLLINTIQITRVWQIVHPRTKNINNNNNINKNEVRHRKWGLYVWWKLVCIMNLDRRWNSWSSFPTKNTLLYAPKHWKSRLEELVSSQLSCVSPDLIAFLSNTAESFQLLPALSAVHELFLPFPPRLLSHTCFLTLISWSLGMAL